MEMYTHLQSKDVESAVKGIQGDVNVCVGKEWHRFPSSFHLPSPKWKLRFIRSEFKGQLPKPYGQFPNATTVIPGDMNDMNREEPSRYVSMGLSGSIKVTVCILLWIGYSLAGKKLAGN